MGTAPECATVYSILQVDSLTEERDDLTFRVRELENSITQLKAKDGELMLFLAKILPLSNFVRFGIIICLFVL